MKIIILIVSVYLLIGLVFATLKTDRSNTAGSVDNFENLTVNKGQSIGVPKESFESMRRRAKDAHFN